jgi:hypothetical protein
MNDHTMSRRAESLPRPDLAWLERRLRAAGFDAPTARALARDPAVDLHALLELLDRGCPAHLAARIVAPLEDP